MRNVGKRAAVDEGGRALERLYEVGGERILEKRRHRADRLEIARGDRAVVIGVAHHDAGEARLEVGNGSRQAEDCHDLGRDRDVKAVLARRAVDLAAEPVNDKTELAIVHIDAALPGDAAWVDAECVALLNVVVQHRGKQVVCRADGVKIAGEMQVDVLHRHHLCIPAARSAALDAEDRAERRLAQGGRHRFADAVQPVGKPHRRGGLALARRRRRDRRHQHELALLLCVIEQRERNLRLIPAVGFEQFRVDARRRGDLCDRLHLRLLCNLNIR